MNDYWKYRLAKQFNSMTECDNDLFPCYEFRLNPLSDTHVNARIYPNSNYEPLLAMESNYPSMVVSQINNNYGRTYYYWKDRVI